MDDDETMAWLQTSSGAPEALMPPGHEDRVKAFTVALMTAKRESDGLKAIEAVKFDESLDRSYARMVLEAGIELFFQWLLRDAEPFTVIFHGSRLGTYVNRIRGPYIDDVMADAEAQDIESEQQRE